jgi:CHAT domain-containing protein
MLKSSVLYVLLIISFFLSYSFFSSNKPAYSIFQSGKISGQDRSTLSNLPWSHFEVGSISNEISGEAYYDESASESVFKSEAGKHGIIHIATHAFTDDESPSYSRLLFNSNGNSGDDGILYAYEIYNLRLNSELAVLSSCNTGMGRLVKGEGIFSLARAFMYAGVPSVVMSLWDIDDRSTAEIVVGFYKRLSNGETKSDALRNVKLDYLRQSDQLTANPVYWAGLVSIGDQAPVKIEPKGNVLMTVAVALILLIGIFLIIISLKKRHTG